MISTGRPIAVKHNISGHAVRRDVSQEIGCQSAGARENTTLPNNILAWYALSMSEWNEVSPTLAARERASTWSLTLRNWQRPVSSATGRRLPGYVCQLLSSPVRSCSSTCCLSKTSLTRCPTFIKSESAFRGQGIHMDTPCDQHFDSWQIEIILVIDIF